MKRWKIHLLYLLFFLSTFTLGVSSKPILTGISHLYQHGYRIWDIDYAGLGTSEVVHFFHKREGEEIRILCRKENYGEELGQVLLSIQEHLDKEGRAVEFLHLSRTTYISSIGEMPYVIKLSRKKSFFETLFFVCRHSRAAWNNAELAKKIGFPTIQPIALVEVGRPFQLTSYLIYPFTGKTLKEKKCEEWMDSFKEVLAQQRELSIIHPDFRPKNVIQLQEGSIQYIDIDDLHRYSPGSYVCRARFTKEIERFEKNMQQKDVRIFL